MLGLDISLLQRLCLGSSSAGAGASGDTRSTGAAGSETGVNLLLPGLEQDEFTSTVSAVADVLGTVTALLLGCVYSH